MISYEPQICTEESRVTGTVMNSKSLQAFAILIKLDA